MAEEVLSAAHRRCCCSPKPPRIPVSSGPTEPPLLPAPNPAPAPSLPLSAGRPLTLRRGSWAGSGCR